MRGERRVISSVVVLASLLACSHLRRPARLQDEVKRRGAQAVVADLYVHEDRWEEFLRGVASGAPEWLELAVVRAPGTDAGATNQLGIALFLALGPAPERPSTSLFPKTSSRALEGRPSISKRCAGAVMSISTTSQHRLERLFGSEWQRSAA